MEKVILFGASRKGEIAYHVLKDKYEVCYFCDNNKSKWNTYFCNKRIISIGELLKLKQYKIIIASEYYGEISAQLNDIGMKDINVFWYSDINDATYKKKYFVNKALDINVFNDIMLENKSIELKKNITQNYKKNGKKNVLMIAYYIPPVGGSGVQRTLKFAKYLKDYGWNVTIVSTNNYYSEDESDNTLLSDFDEEIKIIRINSDVVYSEQLNSDILSGILSLINGMIEDKYKLSNFINTVKENECSNRKDIFTPDIYINWANEVIKNISKYIDFKDVNLIYSTSEPYSDHIIGYYLKKIYNIPWVADYRDSWVTHSYKAKMLKEREDLEFEIEKSIVNFADRVIHVTPLTTEEYIKIFLLSREKVLTITNGYDENDFKKIIDKNSEKFTITFGGYVNQNRVPLNLLIAVNELIEENKINRDYINIIYYGKFIDNSRKVILSHNKYGVFTIEGYYSHEEAIQKNSMSSVLLLPVGKEEKFKCVYTGKVFEYLRLHKPILALSPSGSVVEKLINDTQTGVNLEYDNLEGIKNFIYNFYILWKHGNCYTEYNDDEIKKYERKLLTQKLANVFDELVGDY